MPRRYFAVLLAAVSTALVVLVGPTSLSAGARASAAAPTQSVTVRALPQLAATGVSPEPAASALSTVTATFAPVVLGREAVLEAKNGKKWAAVARSAQDGAGRVTFNAPYAYGGAPATYRWRRR